MALNNNWNFTIKIKSYINNCIENYNNRSHTYIGSIFTFDIFSKFCLIGFTEVRV